MQTLKTDQTADVQADPSLCQSRYLLVGFVVP